MYANEVLEDIFGVFRGFPNKIYEEFFEAIFRRFFEEITEGISLGVPH